jgi:hypothetical protein
MQCNLVCRVLAAMLILSAALKLSAQGTAISYQGQLQVSGLAANTNYDFRFAVFSGLTNATPVSGWVTNFDVPVSNGLFTVAPNFGPDVFNGTANGSNDWLDVSVRPAGTTTFTTLTPRQPILPVPYALFAVSASNLLGTVGATQLVGTISSALITGTYSNAVNFANGTNSFTGTFIGNGASLSNLNASQITSGTLADARLAADVGLVDVSQTNTGANTFTGENTFTGGNTFTGTNLFTGPNAFTGTNLFTAPNTFTGGNTFAGTNLFTGTNLFAGPDTFTASNSFTGTNLFRGPNSFTGTNTFTSANYFNGVNTFTSNSNYFIGSFFGNGLVGWLATYGQATNAMRDAGYLTLNAGLTTVTLPATSTLFVGDIVRVSGGGTGGWLVKPNSGQSILGNFAAYANAYLVTLPAPQAPTTLGYSVTASADGGQMYLVGENLTGVYGSSDAGRTWTQVSGTQLSGDYSAVACSQNGQIVYAMLYGGGTIQKSANGGVTWAASSYSGSSGVSIACTANGGTVFTGEACSGNGTYLGRVSGGTISYSINSGGSWSNVTGGPSGATCVAVSSDCTRMVAGVSGGLLYASSNQGATWTALTATNLYWTSVWMSPDGSKLAGTALTSGVIGGGVFRANVSELPNTSTTSSVCGSQGSAVELQYLGSGQFMPVGSTGLLWAN